MAVVAKAVAAVPTRKSNGSAAPEVRLNSKQPKLSPGIDAGVKKATEGPLTEATFGLKGFFHQNEEILAKTDHKPYIRITVKDASGACAYTRAYFYDELQ